jgi:hypothetical protein
MGKVTFSNGKELTKCCICSEFFEGHGNNPYPVKNMRWKLIEGEDFKEDEECCNVCNDKVVIPKRLEEMLK